MTPGQRRQRKAERALEAFIATGTVKGAALDLGLAESTVRRWLADYCAEQGFGTNIVRAAVAYATKSATMHAWEHNP
jgi:hypothetical protein